MIPAARDCSAVLSDPRGARGIRARGCVSSPRWRQRGPSRARGRRGLERRRHPPALETGRRRRSPRFGFLLRTPESPDDINTPTPGRPAGVSPRHRGSSRRRDPPGRSVPQQLGATRRRLRRGGCLLRPVGIPHYRHSGGRTGGDRADRSAAVLCAPGAPALAGRGADLGHHAGGRMVGCFPRSPFTSLPTPLRRRLAM